MWKIKKTKVDKTPVDGESIKEKEGMKCVLGASAFFGGLLLGVCGQDLFYKAIGIATAIVGAGIAIKSAITCAHSKE